MTIEALSPTARPGSGQPSKPAVPGAAASGEGFSAALDAVSRPADAQGHQGVRADDLERFEGFVLRSFVESMLPKDDAGFFGGGPAGGIWRSMMAERLGEELAAGGGIGIADLLRETQAAPVSDEPSGTP